MAEPRHVLTIRRTTTPRYAELTGHLLFADGTELSLYADERARVIAQAQRAIFARREHERNEREEETVVLDQFGEIVRDVEIPHGEAYCSCGAHVVGTPCHSPGWLEEEPPQDKPVMR